MSRTIATLRGLASTPDAGVRRVDGYRVHPTVLQIEEDFNVRVMDDPELRTHIDAIKLSITAYLTAEDPSNRVSKGGLLDVFPAIVVRVTSDGDIYVVDGHCRTTAIRELIAEGWDIQEIDVGASKLEEAERTALMVRSSLSKGLLPIEKAHAFVRLVDNFGWSFPTIAQHCGGITPQRVEQLVLLGHASPQIQAMVESRKLTADSAIEVIRKHRENPQEAIKVLTDLVASKGARPVGKGHIQVTIPRKVQQNVYEAITARSGAIAKQLEAIEGTDGWEDVEMEVKLPARVVQQLLALHVKTNSKNTQGD